MIAKTWKAPGCLSVGEWINKLWYIQTMEYSAALKRNELSNHEKTKRNLDAYFQMKEVNMKRLYILSDSI